MFPDLMLCYFSANTTLHFNYFRSHDITIKNIHKKIKDTIVTAIKKPRGGYHFINSFTAFIIFSVKIKFLRPALNKNAEVIDGESYHVIHLFF